MSKKLVKLNYAPVIIDKVREEIAEEAAKREAGKTQWVKLKMGSNVLRFLPPKEAGTSRFSTRHQHWVSLPGRHRDVIFNCPKRMAGTVCPLCDEANRLYSTKNKRDEEAARKLFPRFNALYNVIDRNDEAAGVKVLGASREIQSGLEELLTRAEDPINYFDPLEGFDIVITKKEDGRIRYSVYNKPVASPLSDDLAQAQEWIDNQPSHDNYVKVPTLDEIREKFNGNVGDDPVPLPPEISGIKALVTDTTAVEVTSTKDDELDGFDI